MKFNCGQTMATASEEEDETCNAQAFTSLVPRLFGDRNTKCASSDRNCKPCSIVVGVPRGLGDPQWTFLEVLQIMLIIILV